ncbi:GNAT family N-acetyltransferase [Mesorhizobium sp. B2-4-2]|uniref:GNAT family N-acetyltransferase n=1 Tax=unclassified Mesorhizobium TaxID=325217 RepID=UPI00112704A8|nr:MULTISPECIES: GNAT family N-acetyltransferase [unclassified Mesorhizobium]MBZ9957599.1 GNAT family N-acetyltransferase [Mesorhizobium sp. BR1-1-14]TPL61793.1 GNAT family N-acetyltransferase [Mesorhizobium sp. B2-4-2]
MATIRPARDDEAKELPDIEQSAGLAFRSIPDLAWIAEDGNMSVERHRALITEGTCWVATDKRDRAIAFLSASVEDDALHILEFDVRFEWQGSGIGRALLETVIEESRRRGLATITLTTFRDVAWNVPFYRKFGFRVLEDARIDARLAGWLRQEAAHGMPVSRRCAMLLDLARI